ncbi:MAG: carbohydrate-binding family 9-like protein [Planctomycetota bacterium]|nr:carbohydrate-binding family 9-like protein [Planctomycetota bacterium]
MRVGLITTVCVLLLCGSCCKHECPGRPDSASPITMVAGYTDTPVKVDGKLDDPAWEKAVVYKMNLPADHAAKGRKLQAGGEVRLAWDDRYFYVAVVFQDYDIVAEGDADQLHHYRLGDLCELFLKPNDQTWYWELYVTPRGKKSSFWFPGRGRGLPSCFKYKCGLKVAARCDGTLNDWRDKDKGWTGEMAMPISNLTARGEKFGPDADWRILVARYNYDRYSAYGGPELSATSPLSIASYHLLEEYAILKLQK